MRVIQRRESRARYSARKLGIIIDQPGLSLPASEQEQTDTM
jgi:hypothetical protein